MARTADLVLPPRSDLTSRPKRAIAWAMRRGLRIYERLSAPLLVDVTPPADDPFYARPDDLDAARPGDVLDARPIEVRMLRRRVRVDAWHLRFRTTDSRGAATWSIATVLLPRRRRRSRGTVRALLSYQPAIDSLGPAADPSYTLRRGNANELPFIRLALRRGWAVVVTDYNGPHHAFGAGPLAARLVLDGIRAALAFEPAGLDATTPVGLWGYSGGAQATLFAAELQPAYAPELRITGAAAGGITGDPAISTHIFEKGSILGGVWFGALIGIGRELPLDLDAALTPEGKALAAAAADMHLEQLLVSFPFLRWSGYLTVPSVLDIPGMAATLEVNDFKQATPAAAVYLYHSVHDQNRSTASVEELADAYRAGGADVTFRAFRFGEHMVVAATGVRGALRFLADRFAQAPPAQQSASSNGS